MKIPVQTPLEKLHQNVLFFKNKTLNAINIFRQNILTNRDAYHTKQTPLKLSDTREIAIVPYESNAKVVDSNSFAYALESAMTESNSESQASSKMRNHMISFLHHPARVLATIVIIVLIIYIAIMAGQSNSTNQQPIEQTPQKSN
ncbi:hypothetical protein [Leuconostoc inhae]|uniref:hypothetical protein n=1 Tax=Leuconostoc inhae TaxID=178001 RepID=UPI001C7E0CE3|nr:hypothetical protein [Leuconostoc inhae]